MCMLLLYLILMFYAFCLLGNIFISFHLFMLNNIVVRNINITCAKLVAYNNFTLAKLAFIFRFLIETLHNSSFIFFTSFSIQLISLTPHPFPVVNSVLLMDLHQSMNILSHNLSSHI
jgi:hypothetical protein